MYWYAACMPLMEAMICCYMHACMCNARAANRSALQDEACKLDACEQLQDMRAAHVAAIWAAAAAGSFAAADGLINYNMPVLRRAPTVGYVLLGSCCWARTAADWTGQYGVFRWRLHRHSVCFIAETFSCCCCSTELLLI